MITAQDKILHVANKLGLTSLQNMQGSTGAVYDVDTDLSGQIFSNAARHQNPSVTNVVENRFEVNEALLVENVAFYVISARDGQSTGVNNFQNFYGSDTVILFDLIIGNKRVCKEIPIFAAGAPYTFANVGTTVTNGSGAQMAPRNQVFFEGAGILIPPQVEYSIQYTVFNIITGAPVTITEAAPIGCYLFGTRVLLNFNTSI